ncbi:uncharacterized protein CBL_02773 [Carabus blaptoides fortunei]
MSIYSVFYLFLLGVLASGEDRSARIMNGLPAVPGAIPYQVSIESKAGKHFCGGSIIDEQHVLTAAHCMYSNKKRILFHRDSIQVWAGGTDRRYKQYTGIMKQVTNIFIHEHFNLTYSINDIAVLRIKGVFTFSSNVKPIELSSSFVTAGACNVSGWGYITANINLMSATLRYTEIIIAKLAECQSDYQMAEITSYMICAGDRNRMRDSCKGDSGGPLVCDGKLEGIVSFGTGCTEPHSLGIYTRVFSYKHWIHTQQTRSDSSQHFPMNSSDVFQLLIKETLHELKSNLNQTQSNETW